MQRNDLIPFNLEAALAGEKVITRDGSDVIIAGYNPKAKAAHAITGWCAAGDSVTWYKNGSVFSTQETSLDLFMAPKPSVTYRNIFADNVMGALHHDCAADAIASPTQRGTKATVCKVTILNGEVVAVETVHRYNAKEAANG